MILDPSGNVIGIFGGSTHNTSQIGITTNPVSIAVNSAGVIYVADKGDGTIVSFTPTPLMEKLYEALALYREGYYVEGEEIWQEVLSFNSSVAIAYNALGMSSFKQGDHRQAMSFFQTANNRRMYSDAFWETRQEFMMDFMQYVIFGAVSLSLLSFTIKKIDKKTLFLNNYRNFKIKIKRTKFMRELAAVAGVIKKPSDAFYNIHRGAVTLKSAAFIYLATVSLLLLGDYYIGFPFNPLNTQSGWAYNPIQRIVNWVLLGGLFLLSNFLIASIRDGRSTFKELFKGTALCLVPIVLLYAPFILLSNFFTLQEIFIFNALKWGIFGWCFTLVMIMIYELHDYSFKQAVSCALLTVFTMIIVLVVCVVVYMLGSEAVKFFAVLIEEAVNRAVI
jgi:hypothetical protein